MNRISDPQTSARCSQPVFPPTWPKYLRGIQWLMFTADFAVSPELGNTPRTTWPNWDPVGAFLTHRMVSSVLVMWLPAVCVQPRAGRGASLTRAGGEERRFAPVEPLNRLPPPDTDETHSGQVRSGSCGEWSACFCDVKHEQHMFLQGRAWMCLLKVF